MNLFQSHTHPTISITNESLATYIHPETPRYHHILGVVKRMHLLLADCSLPSSWRKPLIEACYLHDIGYSKQLNQYQFHPLDGAHFASQHHFSKPVISAVLFHSCAWETIEQTRPDLIDIYKIHQKKLDEQDLHFIDLVTYCDLHTSANGESVTLQDRIDDVIHRYGENHPITNMMVNNQPHFEQLIERVQSIQ